MRIIAGIGKGRNLFSPIGQTRPTSDRAREALFSTIESEFGSLNDLYFLDLYSGSGAVGVEALSRGAAVVHSVDKDEKATEVARRNHSLIENITGVGSSSIFTMSAGKYLEQQLGIAFDIIFLDPPYEVANSEIEKIIKQIGDNGFAKSGSLIALERDSKTPAIKWPTGFRALKERNYGAATIYYAEVESSN